MMGLSLSLVVVSAVVAWLYSYLTGFITLPHDAREPPLIPSSIPFIGHAIGVLRGGSGYYSNIADKYDYPISTLSLPRAKMYIVTSPAMIAASDRQAKVISFAPYVVEFAKRILLASKASVGLLSEDLLEEDGLNLRTETMKVMHAALQPGRHLQEISQAVVMNIIRFFDFESPKISQTSIGLFQWVQRVVSLASTNAIYGPATNPMQNDEVMEGFWSVDRDFALLGLRVLPRLAAPEAHRGRKRLFDAFRDYYSNSGLEEASELIKARYKLNNRYGIPDKEIARFDLGVCTALLVNTIPAVFWTLCHVFSDSKLLAELRQGIEAVVFGQQKLSNEKTSEATTTATVNIPDIIKTFPLLESVVMEVLRVQSNNASARYLLKDTLIDDGHGAAYILKKDSFLVMPSAVVHKNETAWGPTAKKFDPARFVKSSGHKARSSAFRAFGGGNALCPGRHFAMNEIISILVIIILRYDIEPVTQAWKIPGTREHIATSILTPLEDIHVRISQREDLNEFNLNFIWESRSAP